MKQKIYLPGIISLDMVLIGLLFKINHWPGAGILLTTGFVILVLVFFPMALINTYRADRNRKTLSFYIVTYLMLFMLFTGMLFKIMHWPGAGLLLMIDLPLPFVVFLPVFLLVAKHLKNFSIYKTIVVLLVLVVMSAFDALLALNVTREKLVDSMFLASLYHRTALLKENNLPTPPAGDDALTIASREALELINTAMEKLMALAYDDGGNLDDDPYLMKYPDNRSFVTEVMMNEGNPNLGSQLEKSLDGLIDAVGNRGDTNITRKKAMDLLYFNPDSIEGRSWNERMFSGGYTGWSIVYLEMLRNNIMLIMDELSHK